MPGWAEERSRDFWDAADLYERENDRLYFGADFALPRGLDDDEQGLDEPTTLPEGTVLELVADDQGDDLSDEERRALHQALSASWKSAEEGDLCPASEILTELRQRP